MDEYYTDRDIAVKTKIAISTLRNERSRGVGMPYVRIGRSIRYRKADVESYLAARTVHTRDSIEEGK
jgi:hypothetical protein